MRSCCSRRGPGPALPFSPAGCGSCGAPTWRRSASRRWSRPTARVARPCVRAPVLRRHHPARHRGRDRDGHGRRQQLRPLRGRHGVPAGRHGGRALVSPAAPRCAKAARCTWAATHSAWSAATSRLSARPRIEPDLDIRAPRARLRSGRHPDADRHARPARDRRTVPPIRPCPPTNSCRCCWVTPRRIRARGALTLLSAELLGATGRAVGLDCSASSVDSPATRSQGRPGSHRQRNRSVRAAHDVETPAPGRRGDPVAEPARGWALRQSSATGLGRTSNYAASRSTTWTVRTRCATRSRFGGGTTATSASAAPPMRVSAVTMTGPSIDQADLSRRLRLEAGDRFNFYTWQRDIDTLRSRLPQAGHYEARVRASRQPDEAAGEVALDYELEPGPATDLVIEGHRPSQRFRTELERAWTRTVVDQFLVRDLVTRTRRFMVDRGFFGSGVQAAVERPSDDRKVVRLTIEPGVAVVRREFRCEGRQGLDESVLRSAIVLAGLNIEAWLSPERTRQPLEDVYAVAGYLDARVSPGQPELEGDRAVLVVRIDEGQRYAVGAVAVEGVSPSRFEGVRGDVGLTPGAVLHLGRHRAGPPPRREEGTGGWGSTRSAWTCGPRSIRRTPRWTSPCSSRKDRSSRSSGS